MPKAKTSVRFVSLFAAALIGGWLIGATATGQQVPLLVASQRVEREWEGDQPHLYRLHLEARQYVNLRLDVLGGKFYYKAELLTPDGKRIEGTDHCNEAPGQDFPALLAIASVTGDYTVEISATRSVRPSTAPARYVLTVTALRSSNEQDKDYVEAWRSFMEAQRNHGLDTSDATAKAKTLYLKARSLFHQLGDVQLERKVLSMLADIHSTLGEYKQKAEVARQAVILARTLGSAGSEADALMYLGEAYINLSNYAQALDTFRQTLPLWQSQGERASWGAGWAFHSMAVCYHVLGERHKAVEYYEKAFKTYQAIDYSPHERYRGSASAATNLGRTYLALGETQKAIDSLNLGLENWKKAEERWGEARVYYYFGELYFSLGNWQAAQDNYDQALRLWRISNRPYDIGNVLQSLGKLSLKNHDYTAAARYLNEVLELRLKHKQRREQADALALLGQLYLATGATQKALECYNQALALCREVGARGSEAAVLSDLGETYYALSDKQQAREFLRQALQLHRIVQAPEGEAQTLYWLARAERDLGSPGEARRDIEAAATVIESFRATVVSQELRTSYLASVRDYYELYVDLLMQEPRKQNEREALRINEAASARSLLESLRESRIDLHQGVDPALLARERELQQLLKGKSEYQARLFSSQHTPEQAAAIAAEIKTIVGQLQETRSRIRAVSPRYAALTQPQPLTAEQIQRELLDGDTLLLEYALGEERSYVWAVTPTALTSYELPKRAEIEAQSERVYALLTERNKVVKGETPRQESQRVARADAALPAQAAALSRTILGPVAAELVKKRLLVVTQGKLQFIPFAALPEPDGSNNPQSPIPLAVNHVIVHLPSASTLAMLREGLSGRQPAPKTIAMLADPVFELSDERFGKTRLRIEPGTSRPTPAHQSRELLRAAEVFNEEGEQLVFSRLENTGREARRIARLVPQNQVMKAEGFDATRAKAMSGELSNYRIVHFATHSFLHSEHPDLSGVVLSLLDKQGQEQSGFLRLHDIYNLKLSADLVVLSACRTGLGKEVKGEGLMSLARGFMYAGAPRVVVSAWSVEDRASATLMVKFYNHLLGPKKLSPAAALRAAQLEMWRDREFAAPYFWAGFVLQGEWQ